MKHTECGDCKLREGDCGYHFEMDGETNYDIASLSACDQYGNCEFFKPKAKPQGDLISREALIKAMSIHFYTSPYFKHIIDVIDNAPTVTTAEEGKAYPITKEEQENNCRIVREFLRDVAQAKDLPECKECRTCKHCMMNKKLPKITWMNEYPFIFCSRHHEHFAPNDTCEFWGRR